MIVQFLSVIGLMIVFFTLFALALNFSKYKKRPNSGGCCGGGHCDTEDTHQHDENHACGCYEEKLNFVDNYDALDHPCGDQCGCGEHK